MRTRVLTPAMARARGWRDWAAENDPVYRAARHPGRNEKIAASVTLALVAAVSGSSCQKIQADAMVTSPIVTNVAWKAESPSLP